MVMRWSIPVLCACLCTLAVGCAGPRTADPAPALADQDAQPLSVDAFLGWSTYGRGTVEGYRNRAVIMREDPGSAGLMIVSPEAFGADVILRYRVLTLQPGTVLVAILSASGAEGGDRLALPLDYEGAIGPWLGPNPNYFFAFHNAPHMRHPFVLRVGDGETALLEEASRAYMATGRWHDIEVGRRDGRLWLSIDGERVLDAVDSKPLASGRIALRIRGTGPEIASAMIRDVAVLEP